MSTPEWRMPWNSSSFCVLSDGRHLTLDEIFLLGGMDSVDLMRKKLYQSDKVWSKIMERPPVAKIWNVIGVNYPTELAYALSEDSGRFVLSNEDGDKIFAKHIQHPGFSIDNGIISEVPTLSDNTFACSGDGTVPLSSLIYASRHWGAELKLVPNAEHREMLKDARVISSVIKILGKKKTATNDSLKPYRVIAEDMEAAVWCLVQHGNTCLF